MDRFETVFERCRRENRKALVVYMTVGLPDAEHAEELLCGLIESGADIIELGVPFSDPTADGAAIQAAGQLALAQGINLEKIFAIAGRVRARYPETPLILFSYYNVIFHYGLAAAAAAMKSCGIDGVLTVDLPLEERDEFLPVCEKYGIAFIPLLSPATGDERAEAILRGMRGFAYCITLRGVTGARESLPAELGDELRRFKRLAGDLPVAAGFGISSGKMAKDAACYADAVVVGSAAVKLVTGAPDGASGISAACKFVKELAQALRG